MSDEPDLPDEASPETAVAAPSSMRRVAPAPWIDCDSCGWRHYPDTSRKMGSQFTPACASCGEPLVLPAD